MSNLKKQTLGAGAALVALSAFVPNLHMVDRPADGHLGFIGIARAQATRQGTLNFTAQVVNPLAISLAASLKFGQFAVGGAGNIKMKTGGTTTANNQVIVNPAGANGVIFVSAPNGADFSLSMTKFGAGSDIYMATSLAGGTGASPSKTMTITKIEVKATTAKMNGKAGVFANGAANLAGFAVNVGKTGQIAVGTTIQIDGSEVSGTYRGSTIMVMSL